MKLVTKELENKTPTLYEQDGKGEEAIVYFKLFAPWTSWTWYVTEYDPGQRLCFGLVVGQETELGYFSLEELESVNGPFGLKIERDLYFSPTSLGECRALHEPKREPELTTEEAAFNA